MVSLSGNNSASYVYDAYGQRVRTTINSVPYDFIYNNGAAVDEVNSSGWIWGDAGAAQLAVYFNSTTYFNHSDWLGSVRAWSNVSGTSVGTCTNLPFGDGMNCTGTVPNSWHYTGLPFDSESGLTHAFYRQLSTTEGRWTTSDPAGPAAVAPTNPQSWNRYAYASNSPTTFIDPTGLVIGGYPCTIDEVDSICGILGGNGMSPGGGGGLAGGGGLIGAAMGSDGNWYLYTVSASIDGLSYDYLGLGTLLVPYYDFDGNLQFYSPAALQEMLGLPSGPDSGSPDGGWPNSAGNAGGGTPQTGCAQKILGRFNAQFGNPPAAAVTDIGPQGWTLFGAAPVTDNILVGFNLGTLPAGQVYTGRFGGGTFGTGSTLHVVSFYVGTMPGDLTGTLFDIARAHLDQGNPLIPPFGTLSHLGYVLTHGAGACP